MNSPEQTPTTPHSQENTWAMWSHLAAFLGYLGPGIGFVLGPLVVWLVKRNESELVDDQGKEALNFNISFMIYALVVTFILVATIVGFIFTFPWILLLITVHTILVIIAAIEANKGRHYRYPFTFRFVK